MKKLIKNRLTVLLTVALVCVFVLNLLAPVVQAVGQTEHVAVSNEQAQDNLDSIKGTYNGLQYAIADGKVTITGYTADMQAELTIPETIEGCPVTAIGEYAFRYCHKLTSVSVSSVTNIGVGAFFSCGNVKKAFIDSVTLLDRQTFYECTELAAVSMSSVTSIGEKAFYSCKALSSIAIGENVSSIDSEAFRDTAYYNEQTNWENGVLYLSYCAIKANSADIPFEYTLKEGTRYIAEMAFSECAALTGVSMPSVVKVDNYAFSECRALKSVTMPVAGTFGERAFSNCRALTDVSMPLVTAIGNKAFYECDAFVSVAAPAAVTLGVQAFYSCDGLKTVSLPLAEALGAEAFSRCAALTDVSMPKVATVGNWAFSWCSALEGIAMPQAKDIGADAFYYCTALKSVSMPAIESVGIGAFSCCAQLTSYGIGNDNQHYTEESGILYNKDKTLLHSYPSSSGDITIASTVTTINAHAFNWCDKLTGVSMPSVTAIGEKAFYWCSALPTVSLQSVTAVGDNAFSSCRALKSAYFYCDAPSDFGASVFYDCAESFSIYYLSGTSGWDTPTWNGFLAQAFQTTEYHTVTFVDYNGSVLKTEEVAHGTAATAPTPPAREGYTFTGWDKEFSNVTADLTVTAQYEQNAATVHTVTFINGVTGSTISTATVEHGGDVTFPVPPQNDGYTFTGWSHNGKNITADITITAQYEQSAATFHTVTFVDSVTGTTIATAAVEHGKDATMPTPPEHDGYTFTDWSHDGKNITADITITAQYDKNILLGDVNGDGVVNTGDVVLILRKCVELAEEFTPEQEIAADFNKDGTINTGDAVKVLRYCVGLDSNDMHLCNNKSWNCP